MACPFFMPVERLDSGGWMHAHRLPLGCGWSGHCTAPGHETESPSQQELRELCNIGYAARCGRLPREREWDSIRFGAKASRPQEGAQSGDAILIQYVCEREHRPAEHGVLEFQSAGANWKQKHSDLRLQKMAECFLETWLNNKRHNVKNVPPESNPD